jgi:hypothetical protein
LRPSFFYDTAEEDEKSNGCALPADLFLPEEARKMKRPECIVLTMIPVFSFHLRKS